MSLRKLAEDVSVSAQALSQYELGQTQPKPEVLLSLAAALGTGVEQLNGSPARESLSFVRIIAPHRIRSRTISSALGTLNSLTERCLVLEQELGCAFPAPSLPVMKEVTEIRHPEDTEELTQDVRRYWGLGTGPLPNIVSLFEARGVRVFELLPSATDDGFTACSVLVSFASKSWSEFPVTLISGSLSNLERRSFLCQQLAYMILPAPMRHVLSDSVQDRFAHRFARTLLLPAAALREQLGRKRKLISWYELEEVRSEYGIRTKDVVERCWSTGIISRDTFRRLRVECLELETTEERQWFNTVSDINAESSTRLRRLALRAITEGLHTSAEAAAMMGTDEDQIDRLLRFPLPTG